MTPRTWSNDDIILALWEWVETHGEQPKCHDWVTSGGDLHPSFTTVYKRFGSWNKAVKAAGLKPYTRPRKEFDEALGRKLRREDVPDAEIATRLGISKDVLRDRLGARPKPKPVGKKRTREQRIADLREALKEES